MDTNKESLHEFKILLKEVSKKINDISSICFDNSACLDLYNEIVHELKKGSSYSNFGVYKSFNLDKYDYENIDLSLDYDYSDVIIKLRHLNNKLNEMDIYFKAVYFVSSFDNLNNSINKCESNLDELVSKMINILEEINCSSVYYEGEELIKEHIFEGVYKLIKLEICANFSSKLYEYVSNNEEYIYYINECIRKEINNIDINDSKYNKLKQKINVINSNGINNNFFDLETIKLLLYYEDRDLIQNGVSKQMTDIIKNVNANANDLSTWKYSLNSFATSKNSLIKLRKKLLNRFAALALVVSIGATGGFGIYKGMKKLFTKDFLERTVTTYSTMNGFDSSKEDILLSEADVYDNRTYLNFYGLWSDEPDLYGNVNREIKTYDISDVQLSNIEDYLNYAVDKANNYYTVSVQSGGASSVKRYDNEYVEVVKSDVDRINIKSYVYDNFHFFAFLAVAYCIYIFICSIILFIPWLGFPTETIFNYSTSYFEILGKYIRERKFHIEDYSYLKDGVSKILEIINSYEPLKLEFDKLYKENLYLLDNPEEMYNKFKNVSEKFNDYVNNCDIDNIKKLKK